MRFDVSTLLLQTVNFAVLVWLLHRFLYKPVLGIIAARQAELARLYGEASATEARAKDAERAVAAERARIASERVAMLNTAAAEAEQAATARQAHAKEEAAALLANARHALTVERTEALGEVQGLALDLGTEIAQRLLADMPDELRAEAWLKKIERYLSGLNEAERSEIRRGLNGVDAIRVISAAPLPETAREAYRDRLHEALACEANIEFADDSALLAGVELYLPQTILRFSWRAALNALRAEIATRNSNHHPSTHADAH